MSTIKLRLKNLLLFLVSCSVSLLLLEVGLRIFQPIEFRVRGGQIVLPANAKYEFYNDNPGKLDATITHTKNSLGFRGAELPGDIESVITIIAVGGSTTESLFISDGKTWVDLLGNRLAQTFPGLWINNGGLDGQSTFGHEVLMRDYVSALPANIVLFLVGANDVGTEAPNFLDKKTVTEVSMDSPTLFFISVANKSELLTLALNMWRYYKARKGGLTHDTEVDIVGLANSPPIISESEREAEITRHRSENIREYSERIERLVATTRAMGAEPVLITQPALYGDSIDPVTGVDLGSIAVSDTVDGSLAWNILELYNDVTRDVAEEQGVLLVDLARSMAKDSSLFYDLLHFSNRGSSNVAEIISSSLCPDLFERFPQFADRPCEELPTESG